MFDGKLYICDIILEISSITIVSSSVNLGSPTWNFASCFAFFTVTVGGNPKNECKDS